MIVKAEKVSKSFGSRAVLQDVSLEARPGQILGILGPAGSGKSTLIRLLMGLYHADSGRITYDDGPLTSRVRNRVGYIAQHRGLYKAHPLNKLLIYYARLKGLSAKKARVEAVRLMDRFDLIEQMETPVALQSAETHELIHLMIAIIHNPDLLIFDEPLAGLSAENQVLRRKLIHKFREEEKTVVLALRNLQEGQNLCDDVVLLDRGKVAVQGSLSKIMQKYQENLIIVEAAENLKPLKDIYGVSKFVQQNQVARLFVDQEVPTRKVIDVINKSVNVTRIEVGRPTLEDVFLDNVNHSRTEAS